MPKQIKDFELKENINGLEDLLVQDSNGITKRIKASKLMDEIDLSNYYTRAEVNDLLSNIDMSVAMADYYNKEAIDNLLANKANASDIQNLATKEELNDKANTSHRHIQADILDLSVPTKVSQLTNDSGFISSIPDEYITESELNAKGYLTEHQDIAGKADINHIHSYNDLLDKPTIPNLDGYATETFVTNKIAEANLGGGGGEIDLSGYATKEELNTKANKTDLNGYATISFVNNAIEKIDGTNILTFTSLTDFQNYTPKSSDVGKCVIINKGEYELSNTHYDWSISTSTSGIYLNITNKDEINYAMFGCELDGVTDDTQGMLKAHAYSNENKVLLKNTSGTIYKADNTILKVKWDMDLSGSTILVKDNNCEGMYQIVNDTETIYGYTNKIDKSYLRQGTSQFPMTDNSLPANCVIHMSDGNAWATRNDNGNIYTEKRYELMFHHAFGICSGNLITNWNDDNTKLTFNYSKYNERTLIIKGCKIRIETTGTVYICIFDCRRHNTIIKDVFIDAKPSSIISGTSGFKNAPIQLKDCYNIKIENVSGTNIAGNESTHSGSGYTLRLINVYKCVLDNININGFWGATGMNCVKDITIQNSTLNRIDVHMYCTEINVRDTTIYDWGICIGYGTGTVTANNVKFINLKRPNMGNRFLIDFNNTYGNFFTGDITLRDCEMITDGNDMSIVKIDFINNNTPTRSEVKLPNVNIYNLKAINISSDNATLFMFSLAGTSDYSTAETKIKQARYYNFEDISFYNLSNVKQDISMFYDSTSKDMYSTEINPKVSIKNVGFTTSISKTGILSNATIIKYSEELLDSVNNFNMVTLTQSEYDALSTKDSNTLYIIKG